MSSWTLLQKYGGLMPSEMNRLKQFEEENGKLKRIVADLSLDKKLLQGVNREKIRSDVADGRSCAGVTARAAFVGLAALCRLTDLSLPATRAGGRKRIKEIAETRVPYTARQVQRSALNDDWLSLDGPRQECEA